MTRHDAPSRCSSQQDVNLRWYGWPQVAFDEGRDLDFVVEKLLSVVRGNGRLWSPFNTPLVRRQFRDRLEQAMLGNLKPTDQIKPVDVENPPPMYEIRWLDIPITTRDESGTKTFSEVQVRLYHSEPEAVPDYFVAHHAHEKLFGVGVDDWTIQNSEIATAVGFYDQGEQSRWGIPEIAA